jgi:hypothetical protein
MNNLNDRNNTSNRNNSNQQKFGKRFYD